MDQAFIGLIALGGLMAWWSVANKAREAAKKAARAHCAHRGWQLLDQTVALIHARPEQSPIGWRLRRHYRFEFSTDGGQRFLGELTLLNDRSIHIWTAAEAASGSNTQDP